MMKVFHVALQGPSVVEITAKGQHVKHQHVEKQQHNVIQTDLSDTRLVNYPM